MGFTHQQKLYWLNPKRYIGNALGIIIPLLEWTLKKETAETTSLKSIWPISLGGFNIGASVLWENQWEAITFDAFYHLGSMKKYMKDPGTQITYGNKRGINGFIALCSPHFLMTKPTVDWTLDLRPVRVWGSTGMSAGYPHPLVPWAKRCQGEVFDHQLFVKPMRGIQSLNFGWCWKL